MDAVRAARTGTVSATCINSSPFTTVPVPAFPQPLLPNTLTGGSGGEGNHQDPRCIDYFVPPTRAYRVTTASKNINSNRRATSADPSAFIRRVAGGEPGLNATLAFEATDASGQRLSLIACPGHPGRLSALNIFLCKSFLYGAFV